MLCSVLFFIFWSIFFSLSLSFFYLLLMSMMMDDYYYFYYNIIREARQMPRQFCTICILIRVSYMMFPLFLWFLPSSSFFEDDDDWLETFLCVNYYFIDSTLRILCLYISTWLLFFLLIFSTSFFFVSYPHGLCNASTGNTKFWKNVIVEIWNFDKTFSFYYHN